MAGTATWPSVAAAPAAAVAVAAPASAVAAEVARGGGGGGGAPIPDMATPLDMATPIGPDMAQPICTLNVPTSTCGIFPQCGCTAQNCNVEDTTTGKAQCAAAGTTPDWNNCSGNGDSQCTIGRSCVDGVCSPFCSTAADCPGSYRDCFQVDNSTSTAIPGMKVCSSFCDPTNPQNATGGYMACGPNVNCYPGPDRIPYCVGPTTASGTQGESCATGGAADSTKCAPGYRLRQPRRPSSSSASSFCPVGGTSNCTGGTTCSSFSTKQYAGGQEIGGCS